VLDSGIDSQYLLNHKSALPPHASNSSLSIQNLQMLQGLESPNSQTQQTNSGQSPDPDYKDTLIKSLEDNFQFKLSTVKVVDFTFEGDSEDRVGHGTQITSVIGSVEEECGGIAPEAEIFVLKVFTAERQSYTSWFIDAFNFILDHDIDIINLSNGSSDFLDQPFIDKINELTAKGVIIVSAIGNEGPF
jgi:subtilisin family serine protease